MSEQVPVDPRPRPKYGEYGPIAPAATAPAPEPAPSPEPVVAPAPASRNRTRDIILTTLFLFIGVYDVVSGFPGFASFGSALAQAYEVQGIPGFASRALADQVGLGINVGKAALLAITIVVSLVFIARHRRAFWVPLAGGALAALGVIVCVLAVLLQDPALLAWASTQSP